MSTMPVRLASGTAAVELPVAGSAARQRRERSRKAESLERILSSWRGDISAILRQAGLRKPSMFLGGIHCDDNRLLLVVDEHSSRGTVLHAFQDTSVLGDAPMRFEIKERCAITECCADFSLQF